MQAFPYMYKKILQYEGIRNTCHVAGFLCFYCSLSIKRSQTYAFFLETEVLIR